MTYQIVKMLKRTAGAVALAGSLLASPAQAQIRIEFPSPEFVATTPPVYYEGRPSYYYQGRWYYRDGRDWRNYDDEPGYLRDWRGHHEMEHRYYEGRRGGGWGDRRGGEHRGYEGHWGQRGGEHGGDRGEHGGDRGEHGGDRGEHRR